MSSSKEIKILLSLPSFGHPKYKTLQSMVKYVAGHKYKTLFHFVENSVIHQARNKAVYTAVEQECSHLMFIDDDMEFEPDAVERLVDADKDIIGALCFGRKINQDYPPRPIIKSFENGELLDMTVFEVPTWDKPFQVGATGTGFLLIKMDVFKRIDPPFFYYAHPEEFGMGALPFPENELSEDISFIMKAKAAGFDIWVDPTIEIGHIGEKIYKKDERFFSDQEEEKEIITDGKTAIFIPTVDRLENMKRLLQSIKENTPEPYQVYVMTKNMQIINLANRFGAKVFVDKGDDIRYATRMNYMYRHTDEPYLFTGSDDIVFHKGWLFNALSVMRQTGRSVIAVNDMFNKLGTNFLIDRRYIKESSGCLDVPDVIFYPEYLHNFCDTELVSVAKMRGQYAKAEDSIVEHRHWRTGRASHDETYKWADERIMKDQGTFHSRKGKFKFPSL